MYLHMLLEPMTFFFCLSKWRIFGHFKNISENCCCAVPTIYFNDETLSASQKSSLLLYSLYYAEACSEFAGPDIAPPGYTAPSEEMLQRW